MVEGFGFCLLPPILHVPFLQADFSLIPLNNGQTKNKAQKWNLGPLYESNGKRDWLEEHLEVQLLFIK